MTDSFIYFWICPRGQSDPLELYSHPLHSRSASVIKASTFHERGISHNFSFLRRGDFIRHPTIYNKNFWLYGYFKVKKMMQHWLNVVMTINSQSCHIVNQTRSRRFPDITNHEYIFLNNFGMPVSLAVVKL